MKRTTSDILAVYTRGRDDEPKVRHIATVSTHEANPAEAFYPAARDTPPAGFDLSLMITLDRAGEGHAETMARVNVGTPGYPA